MLGFMVGCAFLSMWVHNTSAVTMVMPIVEAVIQQILRAEGEVTAGVENLGLQLNGRCDWNVVFMNLKGQFRLFST